MSDLSNHSDEMEDGMLPEYDFSKPGGVRGRYHRALQKAHRVIVENEDGSETVYDYPESPPPITSSSAASAGSLV